MKRGEKPPQLPCGSVVVSENDFSFSCSHAHHFAHVCVLFLSLRQNEHVRDYVQLPVAENPFGGALTKSSFLSLCFGVWDERVGWQALQDAFRDSGSCCHSLLPSQCGFCPKAGASWLQDGCISTGITSGILLAARSRRTKEKGVCQLGLLLSEELFRMAHPRPGLCLMTNPSCEGAWKMRRAVSQT